MDWHADVYIHVHGACRYVAIYRYRVFMHVCRSIDVDIYTHVCEINTWIHVIIGENTHATHYSGLTQRTITCMYVCISTYAISPLRPPPAITNTYIHPTIHPPPQGFPAYLGTSRYPYINEDPQHKYIHHCGAVPIRAANIDTMSEREDRWIDRGREIRGTCCGGLAGGTLRSVSCCGLICRFTHLLYVHTWIG